MQYPTWRHVRPLRLPKRWNILHDVTWDQTDCPYDLVILGVTFDSKMSFEKYLYSVSRAASQRLGILRKSWRVFHDKSLLGRCFRGFVLPVLEYCSAVWWSAADKFNTSLMCNLIRRKLQWNHIKDVCIVYLKIACKVRYWSSSF